MSAQQLKQDAMALPLSERVSLAQALWESINAGLPDTDEQAAVRYSSRPGALFQRSRRSHSRTGYASSASRYWMRLIYHPEAEVELIEAIF